MSLPLAIICDLDSTLSNPEHRQEHAQNKDWQTFHSLSNLDEPQDWCVEILEAMHLAHPDLFFFFITGRPVREKEKTQEWLEKTLSPTLINNSTLYMKPAGWNLGSAKLKQTHYNGKIKGNYKVLFVLEDEWKVVQMWRELGLTCLQPEMNQFE